MGKRPAPDPDPVEIKVRARAARGGVAKFALMRSKDTGGWELKRQGSGEVVKRFATKAAATKGGVLEKAVGGMGSVRIKKRDGKIQEERTYPRSMDPKGRG